MSRDYTYIGDIIEGILAASKQIKGFEIINLGNNKPISLVNLVKTIEQLTYKKAKIKLANRSAEEVIVTAANLDKAKQLLDFNPKIDFKTGMKKFVDWYISNKIQKTRAIKIN